MQTLTFVLCAIASLNFTLMFLGSHAYFAGFVNGVVGVFTPKQIWCSKGSNWSYRTLDVASKPIWQTDDFRISIRSEAITGSSGKPADAAEIFYALYRNGTTHAVLLRSGGRLPEYRRQRVADISEGKSFRIVDDRSKWETEIEDMFIRAGVDLADADQRSHYEALVKYAKAFDRDPVNVLQTDIQYAQPGFSTPSYIVGGGSQSPHSFDIRHSSLGWIVVPMGLLLSVGPITFGYFAVGLHRVVWLDVVRDLRGKFKTCA